MSAGRWLPLLVLLAVLAGGAMPRAAAADKIWASLVLATEEGGDKPAPKELRRFTEDLQRVFGYNTIYLQGDKKKTIIEGTEEWLLPSDKPVTA